MGISLDTDIKKALLDTHYRRSELLEITPEQFNAVAIFVAARRASWTTERVFLVTRYTAKSLGISHKKLVNAFPQDWYQYDQDGTHVRIPDSLMHSS